MVEDGGCICAAFYTLLIFWILYLVLMAGFSQSNFNPNLNTSILNYSETFK